MRKAFSIALLLTGAATAAPVVYNLSLNNTTPFTSAITGTGASVQTVTVASGQSTYNYTAQDGTAGTLTITRPNGDPISSWGGYSSNGVSLSGSVWDIDPWPTAGDPIPGFNSGIRFNFSIPVNAFGFEIGDWATCCMDEVRPANIQATYGVPAMGSGLWIAFDGGQATLPANALTDSDNPGIAAQNSYTNFIGAIDSSSTFSSIVFFGDGFGEYLVAGGALRFASVPIGSEIPGDPEAVPEPGTIVLMGAGVGGLLLFRHYRNAR